MRFCAKLDPAMPVVRPERKMRSQPPELAASPQLKASGGDNRVIKHVSWIRLGKVYCDPRFPGFAAFALLHETQPQPITSTPCLLTRQPGRATAWLASPRFPSSPECPCRIQTIGTFASP